MLFGHPGHAQFRHSAFFSPGSRGFSAGHRISNPALPMLPGPRGAAPGSATGCKPPPIAPAALSAPAWAACAVYRSSSSPIARNPRSPSSRLTARRSRDCRSSPRTRSRSAFWSSPL